MGFLSPPNFLRPVGNYLSETKIVRTTESHITIQLTYLKNNSHELPFKNKFEAIFQRLLFNVRRQLLELFSHPDHNKISEGSRGRVHWAQPPPSPPLLIYSIRNMYIELLTS